MDACKQFDTGVFRMHRSNIKTVREHGGSYDPKLINDPGSGATSITRAFDLRIVLGKG